MLGDINYLRKPNKPTLFLAKPDRTIIAKISDAYGISSQSSVNDLDRISFSVPYYTEENNIPVKVRYIDGIRENYLIQFKLGRVVNWFIITSINDVMGNDGDQKAIQAIALPHELSFRNIKSYTAESKGAIYVLNELLHKTKWAIGTVDPDFELSKRTFDFQDNTLIDCIYKIAETYNAIVEWNSEKRTIDFIKPEVHGFYKGLSFKYGNLLKGFDRESNSNEQVTRLRPEGRDGLTINSINPTGQSYIADYSYFMYPFARDEQKNVLKHSQYMSDSLCHAILDYNKLIKANETAFAALRTDRDAVASLIHTKEAQLKNLKIALKVIEDIEGNQLINNNRPVMFIDNFSYSGNTATRNFNSLQTIYPYVVMCKAVHTSDIQVGLNGVTKTLPSNKWTVLGKLKGVTGASVQITGAGSAEVSIQIANISLMEHASVSNEQEIIERYCANNKRMQIEAKQAEIDAEKIALNSIYAQIKNLQFKLSEQQNFTNEQLLELEDYIREKDFKDSNYVDVEDLFQAGKDKFVEVRTPQLAMNVDVVDFLQVVEEQGKWDKLILGDEIRVEYDRIGVKVTAKIIGIDYNFEEADIKLTIANVTDINNETSQIEKYFAKSTYASTTLDANKLKWLQASVDTSDMSLLFKQFYDRVTEQINMSINNTVDINNLGIIISDPNDPLRFIRLNSGAIGLTKSGGQVYETAITADGLIAETLYGKIILSERVIVGDANGVWLMEGPKTTITDACQRLAMGIGLIESNPDLYGIVVNRYSDETPCSTSVVNKILLTSKDGLKIQKKDGTGFKDVLFADLNGTLKHIGHFQSGEGEKVFTIDDKGLALGSSVWGQAPFHADYFGNVWMNKLFADDADIKNSIFKDGHIEGSTITLRNGGGVMKLNPAVGFHAGAENFTDAIASIAMDGTAKFKKMKVTDGNNQLMIDSQNKFIDFGLFDLRGAGAIYSDLLSANFVSANYGYISDLTAGKLSTLTNAAETDWTNYIHVEKNYIKLITGQISGAGVQQKDSQNRLLYWANASKTGQFGTTVTPYPVMKYQMNEKVKMLMDFKGSGDAAFPRIAFGLGDGAISDSAVADGMGNNKSSRGFIEKPVGSFDINYFASNNARERSIKLKDDGIHLKSEDEKISQIAKNFEFGITTGGSLSIKHVNGCELEFTAAGRIKMKATAGLDFDAPSYNFS
ncbi:phage tail spike protein [Paenibacillus sp. NPDC058174]|uniref:phage tail spike protein n=1 Tax=Paenibacillus sp. NPDC058174 TaxID=3346366 RepID=UPI0036DF4DCF